MDYILCLLLLPAIIVLGVTKSEPFCDENYCNSTDTNLTIKRDLILDSCRNLTQLKLTPHIHTLELGNCTSNDLRMADISELAWLTYLVLHSGHLVELSDEQFAKLPRLELLVVTGTCTERVSANAFEGLSNLWFLSLQNNSLSSLPDNIFQPLLNLKYLYLCSNKLVALQENIFIHNPRLRTLVIYGNPLTKLLPKTLESLTELNVLDLSNCSSLHELQVHSTEFLILNNSGINRLDILGKVNKVQAENNQITVLKIDNKLPLTELDLHGNKLESHILAGILVGMWRLQRLDLSMNHIGDLPTLKSAKSGEVFILPNLRFVNLSGNRLEHLRGDSPMLSPSLTHLDLSYNRISFIEPHVFGVVNNLQSLHIEGNLIRHFKYKRFHNEQRGLKEVALYENEFSKESYYNITKYFTEAGVLVIEKHQNAVVETFEQEASDGWSFWEVLIFIFLLFALASNVVLFLRLQRASGCSYGPRRSSRLKASFISINDPDN